MKPIYWIGLGVLAVISIALDYFDNPNAFPIFYMVFGFGGAFLFIFFARYVLKKFLMREEDYYDS